MSNWANFSAKWSNPNPNNMVFRDNYQPGRRMVAIGG
jgi:hypothetical protein